MEAKNDVKLHLQSVHTADAIIGATDTIALAIHSYCSQPHHKLIPHKIYGFWRSNNTNCDTANQYGNVSLFLKRVNKLYLNCIGS